VWPLESLSLKERVLHVNSRKKSTAQASVVIANNNAKQHPPPPDPAPTPAKENSSPLTITQSLMVGSIVVGLAGIYYKREELKVRAKTLFGEKKMPEPARVEPDPAPAPQPKGLRPMD